MSRSNYDTLELIVKWCEKIDEIHLKYQKDYRVFAQQTEYALSVSMCLQQIGELAKSLTPDFLEEYHEMDWKNIMRLRDRIAHHYGGLDLESLYMISLDAVPELLYYVRSILVKSK